VRRASHVGDMELCNTLLTCDLLHVAGDKVRAGK